LRRWRRCSACEKMLLLAFLLSLPLCNPWVRGDGIGYYAFARAALIDHTLHFEKDYLAGNADFVQRRVDENGRFKPEFYTPTGYLENHFSVGPAILWSPFLVTAHVVALTLHGIGFPIHADGFTFPYRWAMALGTAAYGFLGLWISFHLARHYVAERWAFLGTLGIWWGSSLPVYMYFNPSWSHAHSAFCIALFLWYWHRTRDGRSTVQWVVLGLLSALMMNVYYLNAMVLVIPGIEALATYWRRLRGPDPQGPGPARLVGQHMLFAAVAMAGMLPTFLTRQIIYGSPFESGYTPLRDWLWRSPAFLNVLFSSDHGLLSWTPLLGLAVAGLFVLARRERSLAGLLIACTVAFYFFVSIYPDWDGLSSYGNRFFVSLTPVFIIGLAALLAEFGGWFAKEKAALAGAASVMALFVVWNLGFIFQWGMHLLPARGPISWSEMARNQVTLVPARLAGNVRDYFIHRNAMMQRIEQEDIRQQKMKKPPNP
jgi:hypothetical protein